MQDGDVEVDDMYERFINDIQRYTGNYSLRNLLVNAGKNYGNYGYGATETNLLEHIADIVIMKSHIIYEQYHNKVAVK